MAQRSACYNKYFRLQNRVVIAGKASTLAQTAVKLGQLMINSLTLGIHLTCWEPKWTTASYLLPVMMFVVVVGQLDSRESCLSLAKSTPKIYGRGLSESKVSGVSSAL